MPTLEDTVDFKVATLNDLLDADVRTGVPVAADDKYKRWAFLSTGLAGMLLIALIISVVTGGGDNGGGTTATKSLEPPPNTSPVDIAAGPSVPTGVDLGAKVGILDVDGNVVASGTVTQIRDTKNPATKQVTKTVVVAVPSTQVKAVTAAKGAGKVTLQPGVDVATTTTVPAAGTAPTPIEPAPATTPTS